MREVGRFRVWSVFRGKEMHMASQPNPSSPVEEPKDDPIPMPEDPPTFIPNDPVETPETIPSPHD